MMTAHPITADSLDGLTAIYGRFQQAAIPEYRWAFEPLPFADFGAAIRLNALRGFWVEDTAVGGPVGLMLYRLEDHRAVEINVIYSELTDHKTLLDRLMRLFIPAILAEEGWEVVSFAMLGKQEAFIRTIHWYGFKPVGQAILNFDFLDPLTLQIMKQQVIPLPGDDYRLDGWRPEYAGGVAETLYEAFHQAADALWDPRFRTLAGARKVVGLLTTGLMGRFLPECTTVVLKNDQPVGFCFLLQDTATTGNIPLVGVHPAEKKKNLGNLLLQSTLSRCMEELLASRSNVFKISTTMDTDNIPAIKMYRRVGFREEYNYPHVYLTRETAAAFIPGKWC